MAITKARAPADPTRKKGKRKANDPDVMMQKAQKIIDQNYKMELKSGKLFERIKKQEAYLQANNSNNNNSNGLIVPEPFQDDVEHEAIEITDEDLEQEKRERRDFWKDNTGLLKNKKRTQHPMMWKRVLIKHLTVQHSVIHDVTALPDSTIIETPHRYNT